MTLLIVCAMHTELSVREKINRVVSHLMLVVVVVVVVVDASSCCSCCSSSSCCSFSNSMTLLIVCAMHTEFNVHEQINCVVSHPMLVVSLSHSRC